MPSTVADQAVFRRRIILCMDGAETNAFRWYENVNMSPHTYQGEQWIQIAGYFAEKTQHELDQQVLNGYQFISNTIHDYQKDEIWVIGFNRGANAAKSLVGMLYAYGLLPSHQMTPKNLRAAYDIFKTRLPVTFRYKTPQIRFLGCFDTADSLDLPNLSFYMGGTMLQNLLSQRYYFHDTKIAPYWVQSAFHAVEIQGHRQWFYPIQMNYAAKPYCEQELIQLWLADSEADDAAHKALEWMMQMGKDRGMVFTKPIQDICHAHRASFMHRLIHRKSLKVLKKQGVHAIYDKERLSYFTSEELAAYPANTLHNYVDYLLDRSEKRQNGDTSNGIV